MIDSLDSAGLSFDDAHSWQPMAPTGFVTVGFTDIYEGDLLWKDHSASMKVAVADMLKLMREQLVENNGHECRQEGGAMMVVFGSAIDAVNWGSKVQTKMLSLTHPLDPILRHPCASVIPRTAQGDIEGTHGNDHTYRGIRVCMGFHAGKPYFETEEDGTVHYYGPTIHVAGRIASSAQGGQLLISQPVYKEIAPFCWPQEENPLTFPLVVNHRGWVELRGLAITSQSMHQIFEVSPWALKDRQFSSLEIKHRVKGTFEYMASSRKMRGESCLKDDANNVKALTAQLKMFSEEIKIINANLSEKEEMIFKLKDEIKELSQNINQLEDTKQQSESTIGDLRLQIAETNATAALQTGTSEQLLLLKISDLEEQIISLKSINTPIGQELAITSPDPCCFVLSGLQKEVSSIYSSILPSVLPTAQNIIVKWTDGVPHQPDVLLTAHVFFASPEDALQGAKTINGQSFLGSEPLQSRTFGGNTEFLEDSNQCLKPTQQHSLKLSTKLLRCDDKLNPRTLVGVSLIKVQNLRMGQMLNKFIGFCKSYLSAASSFMEITVKANTANSCDSDASEQDDEEKLFQLDIDSREWINTTSESIGKSFGSSCAWTPIARDVLVLFGSVKRFVSASLEIMKSSSYRQGDQNIKIDNVVPIRDTTRPEPKSNGSICETIGLVTSRSRAIQVGCSSKSVSVQTENFRSFKIPISGNPRGLRRGTTIRKNRKVASVPISGLYLYPPAPPISKKKKPDVVSLATLRKLQLQQRMADSPREQQSESEDSDYDDDDNACLSYKPLDLMSDSVFRLPQIVES